MTKRRRKRLRRKNRSLLQTLDISFQPDDTGCDVIATYQSGKEIVTRFNKKLELEDQQQISDAFFLGYKFTQFQEACPELAESCEDFKGDRKELKEGYTDWTKPSTGV